MTHQEEPARDADHKAASAELGVAVEKFMQTVGWEGVLTGWALVGHLASVCEQCTDLHNAYPTVFSGGEMPAHTAVGLFKMGQETVLSELRRELG